MRSVTFLIISACFAKFCTIILAALTTASVGKSSEACQPTMSACRGTSGPRLPVIDQAVDRTTAMHARTTFLSGRTSGTAVVLTNDSSHAFLNSSATSSI